MGTRTSFRPRPVDANKPLLIVRDLSELDAQEGNGERPELKVGRPDRGAGQAGAALGHDAEERARGSAKRMAARPPPPRLDCCPNRPPGRPASLGRSHVLPLDRKAPRAEPLPRRHAFPRKRRRAASRPPPGPAPAPTRPPLQPLGQAKKPHKEIPTPEVHFVETHHRDYLPVFVPNQHYAHGKGERGRGGARRAAERRPGGAGPPFRHPARCAAASAT